MTEVRLPREAFDKLYDSVYRGKPACDHYYVYGAFGCNKFILEEEKPFVSWDKGSGDYEVTLTGHIHKDGTIHITSETVRQQKEKCKTCGGSRIVCPSPYASFLACKPCPDCKKEEPAMPFGKGLGSFDVFEQLKKSEEPASIEDISTMFYSASKRLYELIGEIMAKTEGKSSQASVANTVDQHECRLESAENHIKALQKRIAALEAKAKSK